jgi:hypothetical protein
MTTFGDMLFSMGGVPHLPNIPFGRVSKPWFVAPGTDAGGSDGHRGDKVSRPFATLAQAQSVATADHNDTVFMLASSNTAANTTDYQSTALDWAKDGVHLIGVNAGGAVAQRSRIAQLSTATNVDNLFTVSADNCLIANIHVFHGVNDATSKGAVLVSGSRNRFYNCHFAGIGHDAMDTAANYSLSLTGSENLFERCVIGLDTIARGTAATYEMSLSGGATRNWFKDCIIESYAEAAGFAFLNVGATGIDRWTIFENCLFVNAIQSAATTMTEALAVAAGTSPGGMIMLRNCTLIGATDWETTGVSGRVYIDGAAPTAATSGLAVAVAAA